MDNHSPSSLDQAEYETQLRQSVPIAYLRYLIVTTLIVLTLAAAINVFADPSGIYRPDTFAPAQYVDALLSAKRGVWWPEGSIEDRAIKKELATRSTNADCIVIGSSRVMQAGSRRKTRSLADVCSSILNLGVSGAGIEDHLVLAFLALENAKPKKIVLGVDPWTMAFGKERGWSYYAEDYRQATQAILGRASIGSGQAEDNAFKSKLRNLLSLEYTWRAVGKIAGELNSGIDSARIANVPIIDETIGGPYPAFLPDGSLQPSGNVLAEVQSAVVPQGERRGYKTEGALNTPEAVKAYRSLLAWIRSKGVEPILLLTPYHQNVWKSTQSADTLALSATEPIVRAMGIELGIRVIGAYRPDVAGCADSEFLDYLHPNADCLAKLTDLRGLTKDL